MSDMSSDILDGLTASRLDAICDQFRVATERFPWITSFKPTCNGKPLTAYLSRDGDYMGTPPAFLPGKPLMTTMGVGLSGRSIAIAPSHGEIFNGSYWAMERSDPCGLGVLEDLNSVRICEHIKTFLINDGATLHCCRDLVESDCCHSITENPWWELCAQSWLKYNGIPCNVWGYYTGNCGADDAVNRITDDLYARPRYSNYRGTDVNIAVHTNASTGSWSGTYAYYSTVAGMPSTPYIAQSLSLANYLRTGVAGAVQGLYDSTWNARSTGDYDYAEVTLASRPATLIELAYHDNCSRDAIYLADDYFRSVLAWGLYNNLCAYFGSTPTWDSRSCQYVSDTIPSTMAPGGNYPVSITYRNMGVGWKESDSSCPQFKPFRLGAVGDSDPFAAFTRVAVSGYVRPGDAYTFNFTLTAPSTTGTYTTEWQMLRENDTWFGPIVAKQIEVSGPPPPCYTLTLTAQPAGAGNLGGGGSYPGGSVSLSETPNAGFCFMNWSSDSGGSTILTRKGSWTYTMPSADTILYANFTKAVFYEGFEGLNASDATTSYVRLAMNDTGNPGTNGDKNSGNPWWGQFGITGGYTYNQNVVTSGRTGTRALYSGNYTGYSPIYYGNELDYVNVAYRFNNGSAYTGNVYFDWWFYDRTGTAYSLGSHFHFCEDPASLVYTSNTNIIPTTADYVALTPPAKFVETSVAPSVFSQKLSLGMGNLITVSPVGAIDFTKYQVRLMAGSQTGGSATPYTGQGTGWYNTTVARSVAWHHGRITVGPASSGGNAVAFFLDDMNTAVLTGTATGALYNALELSSGRSRTGIPANDYSGLGPNYDDVSFGTLPVVTAAPASNITTSAIQWNWTVDAADSYNVWTAATGGTSTARSATNYPESGLTANTQYSRWVEGIKTQQAGNISTVTRTALAPRYTLANAPTHGTSGNVTIQCDKGQSSTIPAGSNVTFTFNNAFGTGAANVGQFGYLWDTNPGNPSSWAGETLWTSGAMLVKQVGASGSCYLHIRSYNNGSPKLTGGTVLNLGPYTVATPVARISDLWALANGPAYALSGKTVTGVVGGEFWIEENDRTAAIKVVYGGPMPAGNHSVDVTGVLDSSSGQRVLNASYIKDNGPAAPIEPLGMVERSAGGGAVNAATPGIVSGSGLYNVGMLVRIAGTAGGADTSDPANKFFYLDDGSGLADGPIAGIKVLCGSVTPPSSGSVVVTGLVGIAEGKPVIVIRDSDDIRAP